MEKAARMVGGDNTEVGHQAMIALALILAFATIGGLGALIFFSM